MESVQPDPQEPAQEPPSDPANSLLVPLLRSRWIVIFALLLGAVGGVLYGVVQPNTYLSTGKLLVRYSARDDASPETVLAGPGQQGFGQPRDLVNNEVELLSVPQVFEHVVLEVTPKRIGASYDPTLEDSDATSQPLFVEARAPVNNSWVDLDFELVNAVTGETRPVEVEVSYYAGHDSDGDWTEGGRDKSAGLARVPRGDYFLRISSSSDPSVKDLPYNVVVRAGGVFWSNFFLSLGAILIYPGWVLWRRIAFEHRRWNESDFTPFASFLPAKDDDD